MLPPNPDDFRVKFSQQAGLEYVWVAEPLCTSFQDKGYIYLNRFASSNGVRYNLMSRGKPQRMLSADNVPPSVSIHYPDEWDGNAQAADTMTSDDDEQPDPQGADDEVLAPGREFSLDAD